MAENLIKRFEPWERIIHGVHLAAFFILTLTGLGLFAHKLFGLTSLFGGVDTSRAIHHYAGVVFIFTFLIISFAWMKDYMFNASDIEWAKVLGGYLNHKAKVPPQGMYNPGQKMLGWYVFFGGIVMTGTGLAMWFPFYLAPAIQTWMYFLHNLCFIGFMLLMVVHVYLGTIGLPGTIGCMINGYVTEGWARHHHPLWYEKVKNRQ